ncbi:uncharacterized protein At1g65710-like isoform X2 [Malania oleifera]|uniref:uncharacterized protein At1g65710-like isoform X2 n=1 Tax=Malania oleifera TaxID=397392 RepID=UPI0025ADD1CC|nr:uncharacterized protein At1g65710-like isoform X2 [Malania oleifera]
MGSCFSKKRSAPSSSQAAATVTISGSSRSLLKPNNETHVEKEQEEKKKQVAEPEMGKKKEEERVKKEIFVIKHRKSHDGTVDRRPPDGVSCAGNSPVGTKCEAAEMGTNNSPGFGNDAVIKGVGVGERGGEVDLAAPPAVAAMRTSSCSKEELDAILIQCGRLSRCSSGKASASDAASGSGRKYSGSKRSYDFDNDDGKRNGDSGTANNAYGDDEDDEKTEKLNYRRQRDGRRSRASSHERRRTPSREREQQQRSGSRDRGGSGSGRRVSRSPGRRSENPQTTTTTTTTNSAAAAAGSADKSSAQANCGITIGTRPGKMVAVPASVTSLAMDKSNNNGGIENANTAPVRRVLVRRNCGEAGVGSRTSASPRSQSPANPNGNANCHQQPSLSRGSSRKAEQSPYRRNPLSEIDTNSLAIQQQPPFSNKNVANTTTIKVQNSNKTTDVDGEGYQPKELPSNVRPLKTSVEVSNNNVQVSNRSNKSNAPENNVATVNGGAEEQLHQIAEGPFEPKGMNPKKSLVEVTTVAAGDEILDPRTLTRSRSSRRSRDLDFNPDSLMNPITSYNKRLLEDIQNFHQKNTSGPSFSLPPCVTKACSILEAVADLKSCTANLSSGFSTDKRSPTAADSSNRKENNFSLSVNAGAKKRIEAKDPFMESEIVVNDDLMEPSFHKYVTVRRGTIGGEDMEEQESSGSNSFVGSGQQHWGSSTWEPSSADSSDCWTSRSNNMKGEEPSPPGFQRQDLLASGCDGDEGRGRLSRKKKESDHQQNRIGRGGIGAGRVGVHTVPAVATAASR